ncbi:MAG: LptF/LptG family permease [Flavobacteriales bacterium AspAUS03]
MKIFDRYIIRNFLGTFVFATIFLLSISVVIDLSQRLHRLEAHQGSVKNTLIQYYPLWALWLGNTFMPIGVFISIIFFTSRLTNNTEIVAISSSGVSLHRLFRPYLISALIIATVSFMLNHYFLPVTNRAKNEFLYRYLLSVSNKVKYEENKKVSAQITDNEYIFIDSFSRKNHTGSGFVYQKFKGQELIHIITAENVNWDQNKRNYVLYNYRERYVEGVREVLRNGIELRKKFVMEPEEILPEEYVAETMNTFQLKKFIEKEKMKGTQNVNLYSNEYYQRTSLPFSTFILTLLSFSLSSQKRRGGIGMNLALGITLAFFYIFFMELSKNFSTKGYMSSFWAVWLPNMVFGLVSICFYWRRIQQ